MCVLPRRSGKKGSLSKSNSYEFDKKKPSWHFTELNDHLVTKTQHFAQKMTDVFL